MAKEYAKAFPTDTPLEVYTPNNPPPAGSNPTLNSVIFGDGVTDGSWRIIVVGTNLSIQRLESGVWVEKTAITS